MSILGKYTELEEEQNLNYKIPAVFQQNPKDMSLKQSVMISTVMHPLAVFLIWLFVVVAGLLGITFVVFNKPEAKPKDIEFVLVDKEQTPINKNTKYRADKNSRAGGKHDPKRKVSLPKAGGGSPAAQKPKQKPAAQPQQTPKKTPDKKLFGGNKSKQEAGPAKVQAPTPAPRPSATPTAPKIAEKPKSSITTPVPKVSNIPNIGSPAGTGPIATPSGTGTGSGSKAGGTGGNNNGLSFAPTGSSNGNARTGGTGSGNKTGSGVGNGNVGNPGPGNPNGAPGIDAIREPDFGPYMRELQNRIKRNWEPPKGEESRRVVLLFSIARDGRLLSVSVLKSSGLDAADKAAISAVRLTAPFKTLPPEYKGNSVEIQFTFDYNVFSASKYR
ncbi:MAG: TonB family protein [Candidatus Gastranaerophilales bacterium]|nr:TonB family protein [Candidatus Gastranaerophilales bacterium]